MSKLVILSDIQVLVRKWSREIRQIQITDMTENGFSWETPEARGEVVRENGVLFSVGEPKEICHCGQNHGWRLEIKF